MTSYVFLTVGGRGWTCDVTDRLSLYQGTDDQSHCHCEERGRCVYTHTSPRSSAPVTDRGTPAAIGSRGHGHGALDRVAAVRTTQGWALKGDVQVRACAQPCHSADVNVQEAVLKLLKRFVLAKKKTKYLSCFP